MLSNRFQMLQPSVDNQEQEQQISYGSSASVQPVFSTSIQVQRKKVFKNDKVKGQSWGFTSRSTARVILGQVLRIATCGTRTHRGDSL